MSRPNIRIAFATFALLGLAACGGGGGGGDATGGGPVGNGTPGVGGTPVTPISEAGFAGATGASFSSTGTDFNVTSDNHVRLMVNGAGEPPTALEGSLQINFSDDLSRLRVLFGDNGFGLVRSTPQSLNYNSADAAAVFFVVEDTSANGDLRLGQLGSVTTFLGLLPTFVVYGFDTSPEDLENRTDTGDIIYRSGAGGVGAEYAELAPNGDAEVGGSINLTVSFQDSNISGDLFLNQAIDEGLGRTLQDSTSWVLAETPIQGNGFNGALTNGTDGLDDGTTFVSANIDGRFYGQGADAIGGQFLIQLEEGGDPIFIQGAYVADEQAR